MKKFTPTCSTVFGDEGKINFFHTFLSCAIKKKKKNTKFNNFQNDIEKRKKCDVIYRKNLPYPLGTIRIDGGVKNTFWEPISQKFISKIIREKHQIENSSNQHQELSKDLL